MGFQLKNKEVKKVTESTPVQTPPMEEPEKPKESETPEEAPKKPKVSPDSYTVQEVLGNLPDYRYHAKCNLCPWEGRTSNEVAAKSMVESHVIGKHGVSS